MYNDAINYWLAVKVFAHGRKGRGPSPVTLHLTNMFYQKYPRGGRDALEQAIHLFTMGEAWS